MAYQYKFVCLGAPMNSNGPPNLMGPTQSNRSITSLYQPRSIWEDGYFLKVCSSGFEPINPFKTVIKNFVLVLQLLKQLLV